MSQRRLKLASHRQEDDQTSRVRPTYLYRQHNTIVGSFHLASEAKGFKKIAIATCNTSLVAGSIALCVTILICAIGLAVMSQSYILGTLSVVTGIALISLIGNVCVYITIYKGFAGPDEVGIIDYEQRRL